MNNFKLLNLKMWKRYKKICLERYFYKSIHIPPFDKYFYKYNESKLGFRDNVVVLNNLREYIHIYIYM
jgi:hypothetical protein